MKVIKFVEETFELTAEERDKLFKSAGLTCSKNENFNIYLKVLIQNWEIKNNNKIKDVANISERMLNYFVNNRIPNKNSVLAIGISMNMDLKELENFLNQAGYTLSDSFVVDLVVKEYLKNKQGNKKILEEINNLLFEFRISPLMTREKSDN